MVMKLKWKEKKIWDENFAILDNIDFFVLFENGKKIKKLT